MGDDLRAPVPYQSETLTRRSLFRYIGLAAGVSAAAPLLAACGGEDTPDNGSPASTAETGTGGAATTPGTGSAEATASPQGNDDDPTPEGNIVLAQAAEFIEINPHRELWSTDSNFHFAIFDSLVQRADDMTIVPVLAESFENSGPNEWTFKLREGIRFHNGEPLTVETIQWNVQDIHTEDAKRDVNFKNFDRVEKIDDTTFKLYTKEPDPLVPQRLIRFFILPSQYFQEVGEDGFIEKPVGTGPYKFVERVKDSHIKVTANEDYWRRKPYIKDVTFRVIPDTSTTLQALKAGEVDMMISPPPDQFDALNQGDTKVLSVISNRMAYCQFFPDSPQGNGELRDPRVRQALNYAINVDGIIEFLLGGHATRISTIFPPVIFAHDDELEPYPYDPERAQFLLKEAGFENGFNLVLAVPSTFILPKTVEIGQAMQEDLQRVGITVDLQPTEQATLVKQRSDRTIAPMYLWSWGSDSLDPEQFYRGILHTASPYTFYGKPEWDTLIDQAAKSLDSEERERIYKQLQRETYEDPPWLFMYAIENMYAVRSDIEMTPRTDERVIVWNIKRTSS